jgi:hypothetical protein
MHSMPSKANLGQWLRLAAESIARATARFELGYASAEREPPHNFFIFHCFHFFTLDRIYKEEGPDARSGSSSTG